MLCRADVRRGSANLAIAPARSDAARSNPASHRPTGRQAEGKTPYARQEARGGAKTRGLLPKVLHTLAAHVRGSKTAMIPGATHPMFEQAPQKYCEIVLEFLAG